MRCFIAMELDSPPVRSFVKELSNVDAALRVVDSENLHLTLKFLGEVPENLVDDILEAMHSSLSEFSSFDVSLYGTGVFPSMSYMRVVWVGFDENRECLIEMQKVLDSTLMPLGFAPDKRFYPHLTIARVKSRKGEAQLKEFVLENKDRSFGNTVVDSVHLKKSVLTPKGPVYSTIKEVKLTGK